MSKKETTQGIFTLVAITVVNILNYGLNLILGRWLGPELFAQAGILATLVLVLSFVGVAIQLASAKEVAKRQEDRKAFQKWYDRKVMIASLVITAILLLLSGPIADFFHMDGSGALICIFTGVPFYLLLCSRRGYFQGKQSFEIFSWTFVIETLIRLLVTIGGLYVFQSHLESFAILIVGIGFLSSFVVAFLYTQLKAQFAKITPTSIHYKPVVLFLITIGLYELSQILINNCDVLLVKHFFEELEAGLYTSIALIGRIVYFGTWTIVTLLFPKVIERELKGESHTALFVGALGLVLLGGLIVTGFCYFQGEWLITMLFGDAFIDAAPLLWLYALSTTIFACANVFAYYHMSLDNYIPVALSLIAGVVQLSLVYWFHDSLRQVIDMQVYTMSSLLVCMMVYHFGKMMIKRT